MTTGLAVLRPGLSEPLPFSHTELKPFLPEDQRAASPTDINSPLDQCFTEAQSSTPASK